MTAKRPPFCLVLIICGLVLPGAPFVAGAPIDPPTPKAPKDEAPPSLDEPLLNVVDDAAAEFNRDDGLVSPLQQSGRTANDQANAAAEVIGLGLKALGEGRPAECLLLFAKARESDPSLPPPRLMLAQHYLSNNLWREGFTTLERAAVDHKEAPEFYLLCGQLALAQGRNSDASVHLEKALNVNVPESWSDAHLRRFQITCYLGQSAIAERREDWEAAHAVFAQWAQIDPNNADLLDRWGRALFFAGFVEDAFERFAQSYSRDPSINPPELSMAALHTSQGNFAAAETWYEKALSKYPGDSRVPFEYGVGLLTVGRSEEAQRRIEEAVERGASVEQFGANLPLMRGLVAESRKQYEAAERHFTDALRQSPGLIEALRQLPVVLVEQDDASKRRRALEVASILVSRYPGAPAAQATLAWVQFRLGKGEEAANTIARLNLAATADPQVLYFAARVLVAGGKTGEAGPLLNRLKRQLARPGLFPQREEARTWVETVALAVPGLDD